MQKQLEDAVYMGNIPEWMRLRRLETVARCLRDSPYDIPRSWSVWTPQPGNYLSPRCPEYRRWKWKLHYLGMYVHVINVRCHCEFKHIQKRLSTLLLCHGASDCILNALPREVFFLLFKYLYVPMLSLKA